MSHDSTTAGHDYVSPGFTTVTPDAAFPNMILGDKSSPTWPFFRRWIDHKWYVDQRNPQIGFANRDEASILYNTALMFKGQNCLEIGCWRGWSAVHLALGGVNLDVIDPMFRDGAFMQGVADSCAAAGVGERVRLHPGASPGTVQELAANNAQSWSLVFIDGDHEGDAPRLDAEIVMRYAPADAMVLFHDLASPYVSAGLDAMRNAGWQTMVYQTMQIMGVAWRGNVTPVAHMPDPEIFWTLPRHLSGYTVSGWHRSAAPVGNSMDDRRQAALLRAQAAEDEFFAARIECDRAVRYIRVLEQALIKLRVEKDAALVMASSQKKE